MSTEPDPAADDPREGQVVGVPLDARPEVEPSATGVVVGPLDEITAVEVEDLRVDPAAGDERG